MIKSHTIIWDWNGTLLDDMDICISSMNRMLSKRELPELNIDKYRDVFTFPVIDYYKAIGFDFRKEPWDVAAHEFIWLYLEALPGIGLSEGAESTLEYYHRKGFCQAIISAMQHDALLQSVKNLGIEKYLNYIGGIGDHYGGGKIDNAKGFLMSSNLDPLGVTLIGDTLHDAEVARELGCKCVLVAAGHQSEKRLRISGFPVVASLKETIPIIEDNLRSL